MSDDEKENVVLKAIQHILGEVERLHVRLDGLDQRLKDVEFQNFQTQATLDGIRSTATKTFAEVVAISARLKAVEKRLEVIEAPKH